MKCRKVKTLTEKMDKFYWDKICNPRWAYEDNLKKFVKIICRILKIKECDICRCYANRRDECIKRNSGNVPCGGACYQALNNCIYFVDSIGLSTILEELYHHINHLNEHDVIGKIMMAWYQSLKTKKDISKYFEEK